MQEEVTTYFTNPQEERIESYRDNDAAIVYFITGLVSSFEDELNALLNHPEHKFKDGDFFRQSIAPRLKLIMNEIGINDSVVSNLCSNVVQNVCHDYMSLFFEKDLELADYKHKDNRLLSTHLSNLEKQINEGEFNMDYLD